MGQREEAFKFLADLKDLSERKCVSPDAFAIAYLGLWNDDKFFGWMGREVEEGDTVIQPTFRC